MRIEQVPYSELRPFKGILPDYASDYGRLSGYYAGDPADPDALKRCAERALAARRPREAVARALDEYNRRLGAGEPTLANIARLRRTDCAAAVTGQQPGLFAGPLYIFYKALTAIRLARYLEDDLRLPCVPIFWNASDGHDASEYGTVAVSSAEGKPSIRRLKEIPGGASAFDVAVGRECLDLLGEFCASLPHTEFSAEIVDTLRSAYEGNLAESFSRLMLTALSKHGLILLEPRLLRHEAAAIIGRETETRGESSESIRQAGRDLENAGFHAPFSGSEGLKALIYEDGRRRRLRWTGDGFSAHNGKTYTPRELQDILERRPAAFSPDAALRPIVQDALLPTAAYVAGPTEVAYFAQLKKVYEFHGVAMPAIYPRLSATLVGGGTARSLANFGLAAKDLMNGTPPPKEVLNATADDGMERGFDAMLAEIERRLEALRAMALKYEPTLKKPFDRSERNINSELSKLQERAAAAHMNRLGIGRRQWDRTAGALLPGGSLQERVYTIWPWLCKYGRGLVDDLLERTPLWEFRHTLFFFE